MADDSISDDDKALFRAQMRGVKPLQKNTKRASSPDAKPAAKTAKPTASKHSTQINRHLSDYIQQSVCSETILSYATPGLTSKRLSEFKRGAIPYQARLDLHGLNIEESRLALIDFMNHQILCKHNCVLIIHGKGGHQGKPPVIKNQINRWLPQFVEVLAFHSAKAKDGGLGAVYVLLRRSK